MMSPVHIRRTHRASELQDRSAITLHFTHNDQGRQLGVLQSPIERRCLSSILHAAFQSTPNIAHLLLFYLPQQHLRNLFGGSLIVLGCVLTECFPVQPVVRARRDDALVLDLADDAGVDKFPRIEQLQVKGPDELH